MMGAEILKIDASWAEKLTKTRVPFLMTLTVDMIRARAGNVTAQLSINIPRYFLPP